MFATSRPAYRPLTTSPCLHEQHRPGDQPVNEESAEQHGRGVRSGNAEAQHRDERRARDGVVRGLRRGDPFGRAVAELLLMPRPAARLVVREKRGDGAAAARHDAFDVPITEPIACGSAMRRHIARLGIVIRARSRGGFAPSALAALHQQLADREDPHHHQDRRECPRAARACRT